MRERKRESRGREKGKKKREGEGGREGEERERGNFYISPLLQTKKQYEKTSEEAENAMHTLEKADNDPNSTKAKIDKVQATVHPLPHTCGYIMLHDVTCN